MERLLVFSQKKAKQIDNKYRLSRQIGLRPGREKEFFTDCCLAREVALAEKGRRDRKQEELYQKYIRQGNAIEVIQLRDLELQPAKSIDDLVEELGFSITGEFVFHNIIVSKMLDEGVCYQERKFREMKRQLLGLIEAPVHYIYSVITGELNEKERSALITKICLRQKEEVDSKREEVTKYLSDPKYYKEVFPGHRTGDYSNGTGIMAPFPFLMID